MVHKNLPPPQCLGLFSTSSKHTHGHTPSSYKSGYGKSNVIFDATQSLFNLALHVKINPWGGSGEGKGNLSVSNLGHYKVIPGWKPHTNMSWLKNGVKICAFSRVANSTHVAAPLSGVLCAFACAWKSPFIKRWLCHFAKNPAKHEIWRERGIKNFLVAAC